MARHKYRLSKHRKNRAENNQILDRRRVLRLGCLNADGWKDQTEFDILAAIETKNLDVFSVNETHFRKGDKKLQVPGFTVFESRRDEGRHDKKGGGIACLVRKSMGVAFKKFSPQISKPVLNYVDSERLWVTYQSQQGKSAICSLYLGFNAGDGRHEAWNRGIYEVLSEEVLQLRSQGYRIIMMGDFNSHVGSVLEQGGIPGNRPQAVNKNGEMFLSFLAENNLCHLNGAVKVQGDWSTRICQGLWTRHAKDYSNSTVLDYVVVSSEDFGTVQGMEVDQGAVFGGASDHNMIFARLTDQFVSVRPRPKVQKMSWSVDENTNFSKFRSVVQRELDAMPSVDQGVDQLSDGLTNALIKGLDEGVGRTVPLPERATLYPRHIVQLLKDRKMLERNVKTLRCQFASSRGQVPPPSLMVARQKLDAKTDELESAKAKFARQRRGPLLKLARCKGRRAQRKYWSFVSEKFRNSGDISSLEDKQSGALLYEPEEISLEIRGYLVKIFSGHDVDPHIDLDTGEEEDVEGGLEDDGVPQGDRDHEYGVKDQAFLPNSGDDVDSATDPAGFLDRPITIAEVKSILQSLQPGKAAGHDGVINEALKQAPESFHRHLTMLYNRVKDQSLVPKSWKRGRVVLVHKSGSESDINNYRPLTVLTCMNATYSKLLNSRLTEVVERHRILGEAQNGFRKGRSGTDSAFVLNSILWKSMSKRKKTHLAFLDLAKAYDSVDRDVLWEKLRKLGFGGKFLKSLQSMYKGDYVTCQTNGATTNPVYLGRGLRQGCSLSPILFALYIVDMSRDLQASNLGILLRKVCVSVLLFADDILLISDSADGLRLLRDIVQRHVSSLKMKLSITKSKVMSSSHDVWELMEGEDVVGCLEKVLKFKYLGVETCLSPVKSASAMMKRATSLANKYRSTCIRLGRDGPDVVDLAMSLWCNIAMPSLLFGTECMRFSEQVIGEISRQQSSVGKFTLGLPSCAPNVSTPAILGLKSFKEQLYSLQLKYFVRLFNQPDDRWSKDALLDNIFGGWTSPYLNLLASIRNEVGMIRWPVSSKEVDIVLEHHFLKETNMEVERLSLPALEPLTKRRRMDHVNESLESQVCFHGTHYSLTMKLEMAFIFNGFGHFGRISYHQLFNLVYLVFTGFS